jgi:glycosyltransferase involved in cell wall biosynthesis
MPSFNHAAFIKKAVLSVIEQTYLNWELMIVDNFSTDETMQILEQFTDERIRILQLNNQGSIAKSRNLGITSASAEWIAFLDSDDYWRPDKLERVAGFLNHEHDLIYHHLSLIKEPSSTSDHLQIQSRKLKSPILKDLILKGNTIATSSVLVRKKTLLEAGGMNESPDVIGVEDYNTWLRISCKSEKFTLVPLILGSYRVHSTNLSNSQYLNPPIAAINEFLPSLTPSEIRQLERNFEYLMVRIRYRSGDFNGIKKLLFQILATGSFLHKLKAIWMLLSLFFRIR